jgi:hypothetical protein
VKRRRRELKPRSAHGLRRLRGRKLRRSDGGKRQKHSKSKKRRRRLSS